MMDQKKVDVKFRDEEDDEVEKRRKEFEAVLATALPSDSDWGSEDEEENKLDEQNNADELNKAMKTCMKVDPRPLEAKVEDAGQMKAKQEAGGHKCSGGSCPLDGIFMDLISSDALISYMIQNGRRELLKQMLDIGEEILDRKNEEHH
uniref:Protein kinase domain-containing protein n=1 Tax=Steinernema glaseri TaxID=37863 RepID=A0A1I7YWB3_9BILA